MGDHYRNAHCVVLIYDITDFGSLEYLNYEIEKIEKNQYTPHAKFVLVRNKIDMKLSKQITEKSQKEYIFNSRLQSKINLAVQMSAKTNEGVHDFFKNDLPQLLALPSGDNPKVFESFLDDSVDEVDTIGKKRRKKKLSCTPS